jgi:hypothetical protein
MVDVFYATRSLPAVFSGARRHRRTSALLLALWLGLGLLPAALTAAEAAANPLPPTPADPGWPRQFGEGGTKLLLHQPQIDAWKDFKKLHARFATELTPAKGAATVFGSVEVEADTAVDLETRTVAVANLNVVSVPYPTAKDAAEAKLWGELTRKLLPQMPTSLALDRTLAYLDTSNMKPRTVNVSMDPPPILVSTQAAVLVIIDGKPAPMDIEKTNLQKIVNTNWDLYFDKDAEQYYLRDGKTWLTAKGLQETWKPVTKKIKEFQKLPDSAEYQDVKLSAKSPQKPSVATLVLVVDKPTELMVINGEPNLEPITGTKLMWVANTECDLFFSTEDRYFYFLTSGRWFRELNLKSGKWQPATTLLPEDFKKIPANHRRAHVLAAVPGTRQAEEAVIAASIPQTAELNRKMAKAQAQYVGDPQFQPIKGTNISYAVNTPNDVLKVGDRYYLCLQGAWFTGPGANGPWELADKVPQEVYDIPPDSSKHNVTYVTVQESTTDTVTYGYTAGYMGVYVGYGVAMWGTGYYYPPYYGWYGYPVYWPPPYYTYGASAWYNPATGAYGRGSAVYGPYGGYARGAAYNPSTGRYSWGQTAWGPYGAAATGGFYNPNTGGWGGTARASNGYQSWGTSVVGRGEHWARTASYSDSRGTIGAAKTSGGGRYVAGRGSDGQGGFVGKSGSGDIYAGRDGNVYKRDQTTGEWYKRSGGQWESAGRPTGSGDRAQASTMDRGTMQGLNRDASARQSGNYNTARSSEAMRSSRGSYGGGGYGGGSRGFSRGGFGGRRR